LVYYYTHTQGLWPAATQPYVALVYHFNGQRHSTAGNPSERNAERKSHTWSRSFRRCGW